MSTQKWESVTWEWLEREIVDCLLIAGKQPEKCGSLGGLLGQQPKARVSSAMSERKRAQECTNA